MTNTPSIKHVSTTDLENALARTLAELTGWPEVTVTVQSTQFGPQSSFAESATLQLKVSLRDGSKMDELPF